MKTLKYISLRAFAIAALALVFAMPAKAQMTDNAVSYTHLTLPTNSRV